MELLDTLLLIVTVIVAIWGIYQTYVTKRLEAQVHRLNAGLDQSLQTLHRAREAVIKIHSAYVFLLQYTELQEQPDEAFKKAFAEKSVYEAELKGMAVAIGDKELLDLVNEGYRVMKIPDEQRNLIRDE
ncbi:MAG TPA: hypothetical protein PLR65_10670, partial [Anaerolineales bacterium]|nr:hypothetical protein [Anaerolineales bacterium]